MGSVQIPAFAGMTVNLGNDGESGMTVNMGDARMPAGAGMTGKWQTAGKEGQIHPKLPIYTAAPGML